LGSRESCQQDATNLDAYGQPVKSLYKIKKSHFLCGGCTNPPAWQSLWALSMSSLAGLAEMVLGECAQQFAGCIEEAASDKRRLLDIVVQAAMTSSRAKLMLA